MTSWCKGHLIAFRTQCCCTHLLICRSLYLLYIQSRFATAVSQPLPRLHLLSDCLWLSRQAVTSGVARGCGAAPTLPAALGWSPLSPPAADTHMSSRCLHLHFAPTQCRCMVRLSPQESRRLLVAPWLLEVATRDAPCRRRGTQSTSPLTVQAQQLLSTVAGLQMANVLRQ